MPLDTKAHRAELDALSDAFKSISKKATNDFSKDYWETQRRIAVILSMSLKSLEGWRPRTLHIFRTQCNELAVITSSLINRVSSPEGIRFYTHQTASLLGLADHFTNLLKSHKKQLQPTN